MNALLTLLYLAVCIAIVVFLPPAVDQYGLVHGGFTSADAAKAVLLATVLAGIAGYYARRQTDGRFLLLLFIGALLVRYVVATAIFGLNLQDFFGADAITYDTVGLAQIQGWAGDRSAVAFVGQFTRGLYGSGWGMVYYVGGTYALIGRNMFAIQLLNSIFGALTAVLIYICAHHVFQNVRVARFAAIAVAFYPSLVLWSAQGLKDGPTVFFLVLAILATLKLGQKLSVRYVVVLICALLAILSLRFYVFYMMCAAIGGAFLIGMQQISAVSFARQVAATILVGLALMYVGVTRSATVQYERYGRLDTLQRTRTALATGADSGFGKDVDVSTTEGAITTIPMGLLYLLFAPFPWQLVSLRQSITLPEMVVWWVSFPLLVLGLWFALRYRLRMISPMIIFTIMLSLAYSVFQGNVGTAYRQRAQLLVFYFIFVAVGLVLVLEKREERKRRHLAEKQELATRQLSRVRQRVAGVAD